MIKVMFICHGNICRSPMAEFVFKDMIARNNLSQKVFVASSATSREEVGCCMHSGTKKMLKQHNIDFSEKYAVQFTYADYLEYDYILLMDAKNMHNIMSIIGEDSLGKVRLLLGSRSIADPWYSGDFERTYNDILFGCEQLLDEILQIVDKFN